MLRGWCAVFFLLLSSQAMAFGKTGHQMICAMAYQLIEASSKVRLDALIKASPYQRFDVACNWPDTVRDEPEHQWSTPLHYINFPRSAAAPSVDDCPEYGCILTGISMMQARLEQDNNDWQALLFLAHLVSDIHQPLHVSFADDLGGNRTAVYFLGLPTNLHSVWDFALLKQAGYEQDALQWLQLLAAIEPAQQQFWQQSSALDWANESAAITQQLYQHYKPGMLLDDNYVTQNIPVVEQRIQQAAVRLALLLDQVFRTE